MTSVLSHKAQIAPFTHYIVDLSGGFMLNTLTLNDVYALAPNAILADMGTTSVVAGYVYRKVQVVTVSDAASAGNATGYICLNSDRAPLFGLNRQGVAKLN
jgi:hypothetical protein